jgi:hypothetical protein
MNQKEYIMESMFSDLGAFGLDSNQPLDFNGQSKKEKQVKKVVTIKKTQQLVFDRKIICPVCDHEFLSKTVKSSVNRFEKTSLTLRPIYSKIDPLLYDVVQCNACGYAALNTISLHYITLLLWDLKALIRHIFVLESLGL